MRLITVKLMDERPHREDGLVEVQYTVPNLLGHGAIGGAAVSDTEG